MGSKVKAAALEMLEGGCWDVWRVLLRMGWVSLVARWAGMGRVETAAPGCVGRLLGSLMSTCVAWAHGARESPRCSRCCVCSRNPTAGIVFTPRWLTFLPLTAGGAGAEGAPSKGLFALPFMQRALERKKLEAQQSAQQVGAGRLI